MTKRKVSFVMEDTEIKRNNPNCMLCGSPHCALLNEESCAKCYVGKLSPDQQAEAAEDLFYIAEALPENGVADIMESKHCALCIPGHGEEEDEAEEATGYAIVDLGHEHPTVSVNEKIPGKYDRAAAMTVPVQLPVCDGCRKLLNLYNYLPLALGALTALIGLVLVSVEAIRVPLTRFGRALPFLVFLIFVFLGIIVESVLKKLLGDRVEHTMNARAKRIPALAELVKNGWFVIGMKNGIPPFTFSQERLPNGILTGSDQKEQLGKIRELGREGVKLMAERMKEKEE